jgi:peptidoglycan/LPS O-acetylase OafA/YrhL
MDKSSPAENFDEKKSVEQLKPAKIDFKILDGLRGIAALYVVFNHARLELFIGVGKYAKIKDTALWSLPEKLYLYACQLTILGREFVIFFFVLSGFSIAYSLNKIPQIGKFYIRRIVRIYPPYIVALCWAFIVFMILQNKVPGALPPGAQSVFSSFTATLKNIFYVDNGSLISQFWSLKYEVIFYLLVPFFLMKRNFYFIASVVIAIISFYINWNHITGESILARYVLDYNIFFALGVFCFHHFKTVSPRFIFNNKYVFFTVSLVFFLAMVVVRHWLDLELNKVSLLLAALFAVIFLFNFLHYQIKNKLLMFFGNISYTIYITHFASILLLKGILLKPGLIDSAEIDNKFIWMLGVPFAIAISYVFYLLVEKPSKEYLKKARKRDS